MAVAADDDPRVPDGEVVLAFPREYVTAEYLERRGLGRVILAPGHDVTFDGSRFVINPVGRSALAST